MDIYKTRLAKKFFPKITIVDESRINSNIDIYVDPRYLCRNEYWINLLYPEEKGFQDEIKYLFPYDSIINPLSDIEKTIDIIHEINVETTLEEDIRLSILLYNYASQDIFKQFIHDKKIDEYIVKNELDNMTFDEIVAVFVHKRFNINKLKEPLIGSIEFDKYRHLYNRNNNLYINSRTLLPYLKEDFITMYYGRDDVYIENIQQNAIIINSLVDLPKLVSKLNLSVNLENFINHLISPEGQAIIKEHFPHILEDLTIQSNPQPYNYNEKYVLDYGILGDELELLSED